MLQYLFNRGVDTPGNGRVGENALAGAVAGGNADGGVRNDLLSEVEQFDDACLSLLTPCDITAHGLDFQQMSVCVKESFIELAISSNVLKFGQFTLKSGRQSPYFFNAGEIFNASTIRQLGQCYAQTIINNNIQFDHLFGPAYKGIPIVTSTAVVLAESGIDTTVTFNRKEEFGGRGT